MYLLECEKKRLDNLIERLKKALNVNYNLTSLENDMYSILINNKDANVDDILNYITNEFIMYMKEILDTNLSLGLQAGIKNDFFELLLYGGDKNISGDKVNAQTMFSLDSISKVLTAITTINAAHNYEKGIYTKVNEINSEYNLNSSLFDILKFTSKVKTKKRLECLSQEETISLLKEVTQKDTYPYYYKYSDIGYMIIRNSLEEYMSILDQTITKINGNITYNHDSNVTGGKISEENITPDEKGRDILPPGHTGIYANIEALIDFFYQLFQTENLLSDEDKKILLSQPYKDPRVFDNNGEFKISKNGGYQYTTKISGLYIVPKNTTGAFNKLLFSDISEFTTNNAIASAGTSGSWCIYDNIPSFGSYIGAILTNPYSRINTGLYPYEVNQIENTPIEVNKKGIIYNYQTKLNKHKEIITKYNLILLLLEAYLKEDNYTITPKKLIKKI